MVQPASTGDPCKIATAKCRKKTSNAQAQAHLEPWSFSALGNQGARLYGVQGSEQTCSSLRVSLPCRYCGEGM